MIALLVGALTRSLDGLVSGTITSTAPKRNVAIA